MSRYILPLAASGVFALKHYVALALLALMAYLIGRRLTWRLDYDSAVERICFSVALGLGAISYLVLLLGLLHLLYRSVLLASLIGFALMCHSVWKDWFHRLRTLGKPKVMRKLWLAIILVAALPFFALPLYPPTDWDATQYHLAAAKIYSQHHAVVFTPYLRYPVFPQTNQMLFAGALVVYDDILAQQTQLLMLIALAAALVAFGRRYLSLRAGLWAAALLLASPIVIWLGSIAYADAGLMFFVFMSCYAFWNWQQTRRYAWLILSGAFGGLAFGAKYTALFFVLVLWMSTLWTGWKEKKYAPALIFAGVVFLVAGPWLARSIYYSGNPLFPFFEDFFTAVFGHGQIAPEDFREMIGASLGIGSGRSVYAFFALPWRFIFNQQAFIPEAAVSIICAALLPLTVAGAAVNTHVRLLLLLAVGYTLFWFIGYQMARYLVPAFPFFSLATAGSVDWWLMAGGRWSGGGGRYRPPEAGTVATPAITLLVCMLLLIPSWRYAVQRVWAEGPIPTTDVQRTNYLTVRLPIYPIYQFLNSRAGTDYRVFALDHVRMAYFADGTFLGDSYGVARYNRVTARMQTGETLYRELTDLGVSYFLVNFDREPFNLPRDDSFQRLFRPIFIRSRAVLYDLDSGSQSPAIGVNLLRNSGFEQTREGQPVDWISAGGPRVDVGTTEDGRSGSAALFCEGKTDSVYQQVAVRPRGIYRFSYDARSPGPNGQALFQVHWIDATGKPLGKDVQELPIEPEWRRYQTDLIAPAGTSQARVFLIPHLQSHVWFDECSFSEITYALNNPAKGV